jgi:hypothetical protein
VVALVASISNQPFRAVLLLARLFCSTTPAASFCHRIGFDRSLM